MSWPYFWDFKEVENHKFEGHRFHDGHIIMFFKAHYSFSLHLLHLSEYNCCLFLQGKHLILKISCKFILILNSTYYNKINISLTD